MQNSVWAALACGYFSGCFGWVVVAYVQTNGEAILKNAPTWAMQRSWYMVLLYYGLIDPHGILKGPRLAAGQYLEQFSPEMGATMMGQAWTKSAAKAWLCSLFLTLWFGMDIVGVDLLVPVNKAMGVVASIVAPIHLNRWDEVEDGAQGAVSQTAEKENPKHSKEGAKAKTS